MRKIGVLSLALGLVMSLTLTGCLVAQDKYDAVVTERDNALFHVTSLQNNVERLESDLATAQSRIDELESELTALQSETDKLESDYEAAKSRLGTLQSEVSKAQSDYNALKSQMDKARPYAEILEKYYFLPAFQLTPSQTLDLSSLVDKTGNTALKEKWTTYIDNPTNEKAAAFWIAVWDGLWGILWSTGTSV